MSLKPYTIYFTLIKFTHVQKEHSKKFSENLKINTDLFPGPLSIA